MRAHKALFHIFSLGVVRDVVPPVIQKRQKSGTRISSDHHQKCVFMSVCLSFWPSVHPSARPVTPLFTWIPKEKQGEKKKEKIVIQKDRQTRKPHFIAGSIVHAERATNKIEPVTTCMAWRDRERSRETRDEKGRTKRDYVPPTLQGRIDNGPLKQSAHWGKTTVSVCKTICGHNECV